jgi:cytochrome c-type biogenesis protein CcmH/NrfG
LNRNIVFALAGGFLAGGLLGYYLGSSAKDSGPITAAPVTAGTPVAMPAPSLGLGAMPMPGAALPNPEVQARIARMEAAVLADPKNHAAWVALGNDYFDTHQAQKSVDAYAKALALKPNDPNVLTDQGVMFRELRQFDKALGCFQKAQKLDATHVQSLFNMGIVYANDLQKPEDAAKAWSKVIALAPTSEQANQARQLLSQIKTGSR